MALIRAGSAPSQRGPAERLTGTVRRDPMRSGRALADGCGRHPIRARGVTALMHASMWTTADDDRGPRAGAMLTRSERGNPNGRRHAVPFGPHASARRPSDTTMTPIALQEALGDRMVDWREGPQGPGRSIPGPGSHEGTLLARLEPSEVVSASGI